MNPISKHKLFDSLEVSPTYTLVLQQLPWGGSGRLGFFVPSAKADEKALWIELPLDETRPDLLLTLLTPSGLTATWSVDKTTDSLKRAATLFAPDAETYGADEVVTPPALPGRVGVQIHPMFRASDWRGLNPSRNPDRTIASIPVTMTRPDGGKPASEGCGAVVRESTLKLSPGGVNDPFAIPYLAGYQAARRGPVTGEVLFGLTGVQGNSIMERAINWYKGTQAKEG